LYCFSEKHSFSAHRAAEPQRCQPLLRPAIITGAAGEQQNALNNARSRFISSSLYSIFIVASKTPAACSSSGRRME